MLLSGCIAKKDKITDNYQNGAIGFNMMEDKTKRTFYTPIPSSEYYYGQLEIKTNLYKNALSKDDAMNLTKAIKSLFSQEQKEFAIKISTRIKNINLPPFILFSYKYDSDTKQWESNFNNTYLSPAFRLDSQEQIGFSLEVLNNETNNISIASKAAVIANISSRFSGSLWAVSELSQNSVNGITAQIDGHLSSLTSKRLDSSFSTILEPTISGFKATSYIIKDKNGHDLAELNVNLRMFNTLLISRPITQESNINKRYIAPNLSSIDDPSNRIAIGSSTGQRLIDKLRSENIQNKLNATTDITIFTELCHNLREQLRNQYGLNLFDNLSVRKEILSASKYTKDRALYDSKCLTNNDKNHLREMSIAIELDTPLTRQDVEFNEAILTKISTYLRGGSESIEITKYFSDDVTVTAGKEKFLGFNIPSPHLSKEVFLEGLRELNATKVCCYRAVINAAGERIPNTDTLYFTSLDQDSIFKIELYKGSKNGLVNFINLGEANNQEVGYKIRETLIGTETPQKMTSNIFNETSTTGL
jgi:hypothetical protein